MISLNAKKTTLNEEEKDEEFLISYNSPLHRFLEHSLLPYKWHLHINLRHIVAAHEKWQDSYLAARIPVIRIVCLHGKCIIAQREIAQRNLRHLKEKERMKLAHLHSLLKPYIEQLRASSKSFETAIADVQEAHKQIVDMLSVPGLAEVMFYHKWNVRHFVNFIGKVLKAYKCDKKMRHFVEERITNTMNREELNSCVGLWQNLQKSAEILEYKKEYNKFVGEIDNEKIVNNDVIIISDDEKDEMNEELLMR